MVMLISVVPYLLEIFQAPEPVYLNIRRNAIKSKAEGQVLKIVSGVPQFNNESSGIADAPTDGLYYLRKDNAWDQTNAVTRSFSAYSLTLPSSRIIDELELCE